MHEHRHESSKQDAKGDSQSGRHQKRRVAGISSFVKEPISCDDRTRVVAIARVVKDKGRRDGQVSGIPRIGNYGPRDDEFRDAEN